MEKENLRIGIALSGGGMRAAVFHLGILKCLAEEGLFSKIAHISSVSGASVCVGLIYGCNQGDWPNDQTFVKDVLPAIRKDITEKEVQWTSLARLFVEPYYWDKKANLLANVMDKKWKLKCCLQDLSSYPRWTINTTAFETGKDFRISKQQMGDVESGFVHDPEFSVSHAMAASAGFPVLIGPYKLKTKAYTWVDAQGTVIQPRDRILHLWDGGVYDNMGLDPLFTIGDDTQLVEDINYLIVSNAAGNIGHKTRKFSFSIGNLKRLLDINMDQVETLKSKNVIAHFKKHHDGVYIKIGSSLSEILSYSKIPYEIKEHLLQEALPYDVVKQVADYKTTLERMKPKDFDFISQHGYELARAMVVGFG